MVDSLQQPLIELFQVTGEVPRGFQREGASHGPAHSSLLKGLQQGSFFNSEFRLLARTLIHTWTSSDSPIWAYHAPDNIHLDKLDNIRGQPFGSSLCFLLCADKKKVQM